jgi:hypothetical protein
LDLDFLLVNHQFPVKTRRDITNLRALDRISKECWVLVDVVLSSIFLSDSRPVSQPRPQSDLDMDKEAVVGLKIDFLSYRSGPLSFDCEAYGPEWSIKRNHCWKWR